MFWENKKANDSSRLYQTTRYTSVTRKGDLVFSVVCSSEETAICPGQIIYPINHSNRKPKIKGTPREAVLWDERQKGNPITGEKTEKLQPFVHECSTEHFPTLKRNSFIFKIYARNGIN